MKKFSLALVLVTAFLVLSLSSFATAITWNPNDKDSGITLSNNNLTLAGPGSLWHSVRATEGKTTGKWYSEFTVTSLGGSNQVQVGIGNASSTLAYFGGDAYGIGYYNGYGKIYTNGSFGSDVYATYGTNDVIGVAFDSDAKTVSFYKNGVFQCTKSYTFTGAVFFMGASVDVSSLVTANFGATTFAYTPPSGYSAANGQAPTVPAAPTNLSATAGNANVALTWTASTGSSITYNVKRATTSGGTSTTIASNLTATSYSDTSVSNATTYYYVVTAVNSVGESSPSSQVSATPTLPSNITGNRAIIEVVMTNGNTKEYTMTATQIDAFINWYDGRAGGTGKAYFKVSKSSDIAPFISRSEYLLFDKIVSFEIKDFNAQ